MRKTLPILIIMLFAFFTATAQNKLDTSKKELKSSSGSSSSSGSTSSSSNSRSSSSSSDDDGEEVGLVLKLFMDVTFGIFKYGLVGDYTNEEHLHSSLVPYPYYNGKSGNYVNVEDTTEFYKPRFDLSAKFIYNDNDLLGSHLKAKIRPFRYFSIQTDYHQLFEFDKVNHTTDRLSLFHFNIAYDRIRFEKFNLGWTAGASYVGNDVKKGGFSYGLSAEYFMSNNISFNAAAKWSQINHQPVNSFELESRYHRKNWFFSLGYERLKIASPRYNFVTLGTGIYF